MKNAKKILLLFLLGGLVMIVSNMAFAGTQSELNILLSNQIFNFYLSNISNDDSFSPMQGVLNLLSPFTTTCTFNTTGCFDGSITSAYVDFIPDKDLNATVSLNTNLTLFFCNKPVSGDQIQGLIDTQNSSSGGLLLYYSTDNTTTMNVLWDNGDSATQKLSLDSDERMSPHCFTIIINSTGRSVDIYFNNTFKANYSAVAGAPPATMGTNLIIGRQNKQPSRPFGGQFALMSFYNLTLNQTLRNFIWNNGNPFVINSSSPTTNVIPNATNVSITPLPLDIGTNAKGHAIYFDEDNDTAGGNQTYWWVNKTLILEANNSFTLLGGNITNNANITFSARFNDTFNWSNWINSSTINVGDSTNPILNNCTLSLTSITDASGNTINLTCDATDVSSNIQTMVASLNGTINKTLTFSFTQSINVISTRIIFQSEETLLVGAYSINQVNVTDTSSNKLSNTTKDLHFVVTSAPSGNGGTTGGGGGGGGTTTLITIENQNQTSLFFGFIAFSFFVISTPAEQVKLIKFKNIGNATFQSADVKVLGNANKFISASVCSINQTEICEIENINILAGENKFLKLDAKFTSELGEGSEGIIRMESLANSEQEGKIVDLLLSIDRPPAYKLLISPISHLSPYKQFIGDNELPALIIGYGAFISVLGLMINIIKSAL